MTSPPTRPLIRSRADVTTDAPARSAKQLVSQLGRKVGFDTEGATSTRVAHVLDSHLERSVQRSQLNVRWTQEDPR